MLQTKAITDYAKDKPQEIYAALSTSFQGLSQHEVTKRLKLYGYNQLVSEKKNHWVLEYLSNFKNPLVLVLLFAAGVSFFLGDVIEGSIIFVIILFSTTLNFFQEYHASKAAQELKEKISTHTDVIRDGQEQAIKIKDVCIGDILSLHAGDIIPADARVIESKDCFVNQSSLTGESFPVEKTADKISGKSPSLSDFTNILFAGTSIISGSVKAVVLQTGLHTEFGKIADKLAEAPVESEFTIGVNKFSLLIMRITILFVLFIFFFNTLFKHTSFFESFTFAIAVAVGLTPELLPMIMSLTMAKGSLNMAKKGVIVKKLAAIPDFGEMDVLCTDKTGTLTEDHIELVKYTDVDGEHSESVLLHTYINSFYQTGIKNPMDEAVIRYKHEAISQYKKIDEIPFDFQRRRMSVVVEKGKTHILVTKGAPEEVIKVSTSYREGKVVKKMMENAREKIIKQYDDLSKEGFRVLSVSIKDIEQTKHVYSPHDEKDLTFLGFVAFLDPAKKDVKDVLEEIKRMGIEIKVITGDSELVTEKICNDVGLPIKDVVLGHTLENISFEALQVIADKTTVFARCSPDQKSKIIHALKAKGHVVGYMGDGINDAPSLQTADVGISVNNAVDVAKEAADMILTHKSLRQLKDGVLEGRKTFGNTMKYIMMGISSNFGNMFSVLGAVLFLPYLPMLPIQILLNNLLYDVSQISIPTDTVDKEYIQKPKKWNLNFIKEFMFIFGPISSLFDFLTFFILYSVFKVPAAAFQTGWFLESLATQTLIIHIIRTRHIPFIESRASKYLLITTFSIIILGWVLPYTFLGKYFEFQKLSFPILFSLAGIVITYMIVVELGKRIFYRIYPIQ